VNSKNPAVIEAYRTHTYTSKSGTVWRRGLDGWFNDSVPGVIHVTYHHMMVDLIEKENPTE
jgi:hypothetical protein